MPKYRVTLSDGRKVTLEAPSQPSEAQILAALGQDGPPAVAKQPMAPMSLTDEVAQDVEAEARWGRGMVSGLKASIPFAGYEQSDEPGAVTGRVLGEGAQVLAAGPLVKALSTVPVVARTTATLSKVIPTRAKAGRQFQQVMSKVGDEVVDVAKPGDAALRISELAERGGSMPKAVRDFMKRATDPTKGEPTYREMRDFYSNISRLSANEFQRLTPVVRMEVGKLRVALDRALAATAAKGGEEATYRAAMKQYALAARARELVEKAAKYGAGALGAGWAYKQLTD